MAKKKAKYKPVIDTSSKFKIYWCQYATRNFDFDAFGITERMCLENLISGWIEHCVQHGVEDKYVLETIKAMKEEFNPIAVSTAQGSCFRDRDVDLMKTASMKAKKGWFGKGDN